MTDSLKLTFDTLKATIDLSSIDFTVPLDSQSSILGQERAQSALEFGVAMTNSGYNIFVMGEAGSGRLSMIMQYLQVLAPRKQAPFSYAYVDNFENAREPIAIQLPAEQGYDFGKAIENLITNVLATFPAAFENPSYQQKKRLSNANLFTLIGMQPNILTHKRVKSILVYFLKMIRLTSCRFLKIVRCEKKNCRRYQ